MNKKKNNQKKNKEVFVKHEKAPTAPRFEGVFTISFIPMFRKKTLFLDILANFGHFQWRSKGTSTGQDLSYEPIPMSLRPSVTKKQPGKAHIRKTADFGHFGQFRPFLVAEPGRNCQKAHLQAKTFHMSLFTCFYDHPLQRNSLEKPMSRKTANFGHFDSFGHFRWPNLAETVKRHIYRPRPFI